MVFTRPIPGSLIPRSRLEKITFEEMLEMASMGSKVLQIRSVEFAGKYAVPLRVLSSFEGRPRHSDHHGGGAIWKRQPLQALRSTAMRQNSRSRCARYPGVAYRYSGPIGEANIEVDVIIQNTGEQGHTDFTFTVARGDVVRAKRREFSSL